MAISYYTGIPRSGKSLRAVFTMWSFFVKKKSKIRKILDLIFNKKDEKKYINCYTNINQFNYDISPYILLFDYNVLYSSLQILHSMYLLKSSDDELIAKAKELNIYKSLFVVDECHNFFKTKENPVIVWWLTYHAHLHHDIILITQDLKLVNDEYKRVGEYFFKAVPQRLRMSKNTFKYREYSSYTMYEKEYIRTDSLSPTPEIFSLFVSGSDANNTPIIYKYLAMFALLLVLMFFLYGWFLDGFEDDTPGEIPLKNTVEKIVDSPINSVLTDSEAEKINYDELELYKFDCYSIYCYINNNEIPISILKPILLDVEPDKQFSRKHNKRLTIYILGEKDKFKFLKDKNEKVEKDNNTPIIGG